MIKKIYYINLDRRTDRNENIKNEIAKLNYIGPVERISAVDGRKIDINNLSEKLITKEGKLDAMNKNGGLYYIMTRGAVGCALSHYNLAKKIINELNDNEYALILEDDVVLEDNFMNKLNDYINKMPPFDILLIGYHMKQNKIVGNTFYDKPLKSWGTFGFVTNNKGSKALINLYPIKYQVDTEMHKLYNNENLQVYSLKEENRLVKSPQSQEDSQYGTDIQLREYSELKREYPELKKNPKITEGFNNTEKYSYIIILILLVILFYFIKLI